MQALTQTQRADIVDHLAFFGAKYSLILGVFGVMAYSLGSLA